MVGFVCRVGYILWKAHISIDTLPASGMDGVDGPLNFAPAQEAVCSFAAEDGDGFGGSEEAGAECGEGGGAEGGEFEVGVGW